MPILTMQYYASNAPMHDPQRGGAGGGTGKRAGGRHCRSVAIQVTMRVSAKMLRSTNYQNMAILHLTFESLLLG